MKKKSPRGIPDFSRKAPRTRDGAKTGDVVPTQKKGGGSPPPRVKPQATSAKSGQRGQ